MKTIQDNWYKIATQEDTVKIRNHLSEWKHKKQSEASLHNTDETKYKEIDLYDN